MEKSSTTTDKSVQYGERVTLCNGRVIIIEKDLLNISLFVEFCESARARARCVCTFFFSSVERKKKIE